MSEQESKRQNDYLSYIVCCFAQKQLNGLSRPFPIRPSTQKPFSCLLSNKNKESYQLCLFRAITMYVHGHNGLDSHVQILYINVCL